MPTLLGILNQPYEAKFYGDDILKPTHKQRAFIGNYQKLGLFRDNRLTILYPNKSVKSFDITKQTLYSSDYKEHIADKSDINDTVSYYQSASYLYKHHLLGG
jgi:hypothetical protein